MKSKKSATFYLRLVSAPLLFPSPPKRAKFLLEKKFFSKKRKVAEVTTMEGQESVPQSTDAEGLSEKDFIPLDLDILPLPAPVGGGEDLTDEMTNAETTESELSMISTDISAEGLEMLPGIEPGQEIFDLSENGEHDYQDAASFYSMHEENLESSSIQTDSEEKEKEDTRNPDSEPSQSKQNSDTASEVDEEAAKGQEEERKQREEEDAKVEPITAPAPPLEELSAEVRDEVLKEMMAEFEANYALVVSGLEEIDNVEEVKYCNYFSTIVEMLSLS